MYLDGRLDLDTMVAQRIGLGDVNDALDALRKGDTVRSVIMFDDDADTHKADTDQAEIEKMGA
jgi:hypothetical protein